jgi:hypothetical protein
MPEETPEKPQESKPTQTQETLEELSWDIPLFRTIKTFFIREGKAVRNGWLAVLIIVAITIWQTHSWTKSETDEKISDLKGQLTDAKHDRDHYQELLAPFEAYAMAKFTNEPNEERLNLLLKQVEFSTASLSNIFTEIEQEKPKLITIINAQKVSSNMILHITKQASRGMQFIVMNIGGGTANGISVIFSAPIANSNVVMSGQWYWGGPEYETNNAIWNHWDLSGKGLIPRGGYDVSPIISISTNYAQTNFQAGVSVFAANVNIEYFPITIQIEQ